MKHVTTPHWMEGEITNFIKVWLSAYTSLSYCYFVAKIIPKGVARLVAILPVVCLLLLLPLRLHSAHLAGPTAFFLAWLATFKLLMLAFDQGPLSQPSITLFKFVAVGCLPIKFQQQNLTKSQSKSICSYTIKAVLIALMIKGYDYEEHIHPRINMVVYSLHIFLGLEIILAIAAALARTLLHVELEPQFNEPYLSGSLQDFWGRRWNLMVTGILRPTVYLPVLGWSSGVVGREWAMLPAVMATFVVSGMMHELVFVYLGCMNPTREIMWFFVLHGACLTIEIVVKKAANGRWQLPRVVGAFLTVGFVVTTYFWLFFPQLVRCNVVERAQAELITIRAFVKNLTNSREMKT